MLGSPRGPQRVDGGRELRVAGGLPTERPQQPVDLRPVGRDLGGDLIFVAQIPVIDIEVDRHGGAAGLQTHPELGDVSRGEVVSINNFHRLFKIHQ